MKYYVYILTNYTKTVLYIGFTNNLQQRIEQHKSYQAQGFTKKYNVNLLIYYEEFSNVYEAKSREGALKKWNRTWKERLISQSNPEWKEIVI